jgi:hypothetical protein
LLVALPNDRRIRLRAGALGLRRDLGSSVPREMDFLGPKGEEITTRNV